MLVRVCCGERRVWSEVRVPTVADEAARQVSRERTALTQEQTRLVNQMRGWLATWGCALPARRRAGWWTTVRDWAGAALPAEVQARLARAEARLAGPRGADRRARRAAAGRGDGRGADQCGAPAGAAEGRGDDERVGVARRRAWCGGRSAIGGRSAASSALRRRPTTAASRSANKGSVGRAMRGCRPISIQLAWNWVRWQPQSALTQWYQANFGKGQTRPADWDRRGGAEAGDRALAVCHDRRRPEGAISEDVA